MLKKIPPFILTCALALTPPAALAEYDEICLRADAGSAYSLSWDLAERRNPKGLDARRPIRSVRGGVGIPPSRLREAKCFKLSAFDIRPGDRMRFYAKTPRGNPVLCEGGPDYSGVERGLFLNPDGPRGGKLTFHAAGAGAEHRCRLESGKLRMHSECNSAADGMDNIGCEPWRPDLFPGVLIDIVKKDRGLGMLGDALSRGARLDETDSDGASALHVAARLNRAQYVPPLVLGGADVNLQNARGGSPLLAAVENNPQSLEIPRILLDKGADPDAAREDGAFPLGVAARLGRADIAQLLIENNAQINARHAKTGRTALDAAKQNGRRQIVNYLRRLDAEERIYNGIIPDIVGMDLGENRLEKMLSRGADPDAADKNGDTALHLVAKRGGAGYADALIFTGGANLNIRNKLGQTPLMAAVAQNRRRADIVNLLVRAGADVNIPQNDGDFPLYLAVVKARLDVVDAIAGAKGLDIGARHPQNEFNAYELAEKLSNGGASWRHEQVRVFLQRRGEKNRLSRAAEH